MSMLRTTLSAVQSARRREPQAADQNEAEDVREPGLSLNSTLAFLATLSTLTVLALPLYFAHTSTTNMATVNANYDAALTIVRKTYRQASIDAALGKDPLIPGSTDEWVALLNAAEATSPAGRPAFRMGDADASTGQIGVLAEGSFPGTAKVLIERPRYEQISPGLAIISARDAAQRLGDLH